ncbi:hypothetical protein F0L17_14730 [Streptomyces sp. TRM43335]|uniref:Uncharacterized protein n=1 Tax=Streptomyces taklimakanensis TaxID=2569853 RepID=A0A6G2BDM0_9ACTN|nr:DUF6882 domain-containing protein [Streptomyces taklimakanensis]MTE20340.1 hypothetical protein [Streptomyces taklimakanensis]
MTTLSGLSDSFSDELLALARPNLAWTVEQTDLFDRLVPPGPTRCDPDVPELGRAGVALSARLVARFAADGTWLWAWADRAWADTPGAESAHALRAVGERTGTRELTTPLLDLNGFPDPWSAADHLSLVCMGLLDGRGVAVAAVDGRSRAFLVVDDPAVPRASPRPARLAHALRAGPALLPGPALKAVRGWFDRHGVEPRYGPDTVWGVLPGGDRVVVRLAGGAVASVGVVGPDGGAPASASAPEQRLVDPRPDARAPGRPFPAELLSVVAREVAFSLRETRGMVEYAGHRLGFDGRAPYWERPSDRLVFPGGSLLCRPLGRYDPAERRFEWAPDTEDVREALRRAAGVPPEVHLPELSGEPLDLAPYAVPESAAVALARAGARAVGQVFTSLGGHFLAVADGRLPPPGVTPEAAAEEIRAGADLLWALTPPRDRLRVTREAAGAYFERAGMRVRHHVEPDFVGGVAGPYEVRVFLAPDGTVTDTSWGMATTPRT